MMHLYISADMEGTAGVCSWNQVNPTNTHEYPYYRRLMTLEVAAAIAGARSVEPCEVLVNDSHWDMSNLLADELPHDVRTITGARKPLSMVQGASGDLAFFTGYHGAIGARDAVLAHTYYSDVLYRLTINGTRCCEALLNAAYLGEAGIPVGLVTGDRTSVEGTAAFLPWAKTAIVKESIGYYAAETLHPAAAREIIAEGAAQAVRDRAAMQPFTIAPPIEMVIETVGVEHADFIELLPNFSRVAGRTLVRTSANFHEAFAAFLAAMRLAAAASAPA